MSTWFSVEVFDGVTPASVWAESHRDTLMETALTNGATDWSWHRHTWGVVFEVCFPDELMWDRFMDLAVVRAVLDSVPDPVTGLISYRGRGGSSGASYPRKPKPMSGCGSAALPMPLWMDEEPMRVVSLQHLHPLVSIPA